VLRFATTAALITTFFATILLSVGAVGYFSGGVAEATIVSIGTNSPNRHVFVAEFVTLNGVACRSEFDSGSSLSSLQPVSVGDHLRVRYPDRRPCTGAGMLVDDWDAIFPIIVLSVMLAVSSLLTYLSWRRPESLIGWIEARKRKRTEAH
jgi:hypothetical protein